MQLVRQLREFGRRQPFCPQLRVDAGAADLLGAEQLAQAVGQFPRPLMPGPIRRALKNDSHSPLVNLLRWSERISTPSPRLGRQTEATRACGTRSLVMAAFVAQPTIWREVRSIMAARNTSPRRCGYR